MTTNFSKTESQKPAKKIFCAQSQYTEALMLHGLAKAADMIMNEHFSDSGPGRGELCSIVDALIIGLEALFMTMGHEC